ncbi:hypothetical protein H671_2g6249 [Cricetulus griseus]|nr:hypothetical protein H671_2g6249 [Cricetulus griseus]
MLPELKIVSGTLRRLTLQPQPLTLGATEGVKTFKELRAKFQKYDAPPFPGPIKFSAGVSRKDDRGHPQPAQSLASSNNLSSHHHRPLSYSLTEVSKPLKSQKMKLAQKGEIQKNSSSSGPPGKSAECPARNSQKAAMPLDASKPKAGTPNEEKGMNVSSFRYKLWNWEKFSSQKSEISPASPLTNCGSRTFHLEGQKTMGSVQIKPEKSPEATGVQTLPPQSHLMVQRTSPVAPEASPLPLPQHDRKETDSPNAEESPTSSLCQPVYECELTIPVPEKPESRRHQLPKTKPLPSIETLGPPPPKPSKPPFVNLQAFQRQPTVVSKTLKEVTVKEGPLPPEGPTLKDEENSMQEKESYELEPPKPEDSHPKHPSKVGVYEETPGKVQMAGVQGDRWSLPAGNQEAVVDINQNKLFPEDVVLTRHSQEKGGYVEALEVTKETPSSSTTRSDSSSEKTYDDVGCSREELPKWDFSSSFTSDSEDNSEEMYEDIYKAKNNDQKPEVDGRAALRRLQQLFGKEKGIFRMRKTKSKENVSNGFSMSLPDLGLRSQDVIIYDDVDTSDKESKDEDKPKTWKPKFLTSKGKRGKKSSDGSKSFSPKNFFRAKKHNLEKNRMEKEEKLFRERFQQQSAHNSVSKRACTNLVYSSSDIPLLLSPSAVFTYQDPVEASSHSRNTYSNF